MGALAVGVEVFSLHHLYLPSGILVISRTIGLKCLSMPNRLASNTDFIFVAHPIEHRKRHGTLATTNIAQSMSPIWLIFLQQVGTCELGIN